MMKKITLLLAILMGFLQNSMAQIGVSEGFNASTTLPSGWTETGFFSGTNAQACGGNSLRKNLYSTSPTGTLTTPNYPAASNGTDVTFSFDYKIVDWSAATVATAAGWGTMVIEASTDNGVTWLPFYTVDDSNHVVANTCANVSFTINAGDVPSGADLKFRWNGTWTAGDYYFYVDNVAITQVTASPPNCDAALTSPADGAIDTAVTGNIAWSAATGVATGYNLTVGTTAGGSDVLATTDVGNVTSYALGSLLFSTTYYVSIVPFNTNGNATGCTEYSFTTKPAPGPGNLCENPIVVTLPYTTTDDTANYEEANYDGSPGASGCNTTSPYLGGNDVVYAYTATIDGSINIDMDTTGTWSGLFVYTSCAAIGTGCVAGGTSIPAGGVTITDFPVVNGTTYYFVISTFPAPQTIPYTLNIVENTCTNATATYATVSNCDTAPEFFVDVNITNLGTATSLTVTDNQSSAPQTVSATGLVTFGPFANATPVIITITNDQDANCVVVSPSQTQVSCPPANDDIAAAVDLTLDLGTACGANQLTLQSLTGTTDSPEVLPTCAFNVNGVSGDVWYKIVAPNPDFTISITNVTGPNFFTASMELYSGTPGSLTATGPCGNFGLQDYTGLTVGDTYYLRVWDFNNDGTGTFSVCGYYLDCVNPTATYAVVNDCINAPQFFVDVNVTDLGSAASVTVSDNQGGTPQTVSATGLVTFGPYPNNTPVIFTVANDGNAACTITSAAQNQVACPGPNDNLCGAIELTVGTASTGTDYNNIAATAETGETAAACFNGGVNGSVWFSFVAPPSGNVTVSTDIVGGTLIDTEIALYDATGVTCSDLSTLGVAVGCDQDSGIVNGGEFGSYSSIINIATLTAGTTYYVQVDRWGTATNGTFGLDVIDNDPTLASNTFDKASFVAYPNPVVDYLNLSYSKNIDKVQVMNLLGQEVNTKSINATNAKIDMSNLAAGTYLVKVLSDNQVQTLKVVKN